MPGSVQFASSTMEKSSTASIYARPQKKQRMSITQTYFLAHSARGKLSKEAARPDHQLRFLVGHANLLDSLMIDLADAERSQEQWFHQSASGATAVEPRREQPDTIVEEPEIDWIASDAESDTESEVDEDDHISAIITSAMEVAADDDDEEEEDDDSEEYRLTRTVSRHSPPELSSDSEEESDDDCHSMMPPSPPQQTVQVLTEKQRAAIATTSYYDSIPIQEAVFLTSDDQPTLIAAY